MTDYTNIFHTVPILNNEMVRNINGAKCDMQGMPIRFEENGWDKYATERNTRNTHLLAGIALNDFIGIDIDNTNTYLEVTSMLQALNLTPSFIVNSLPLDLGKGGHLLFKYDLQTVTELKVIRKFLKKHHNIDVQVEKALIYLPTEANKTKQLITPPISSINDLTPFPKVLLTYLKGLVADDLIKELDRATSTVVHIDITEQANTEFYGFVLEGGLTPDIVSKLTPKRDFREITDVNQIPQGAGTEWMLQVRKKLQVDNSVSEDVFLKTMLYLNSLWESPMEEQRVINDVNRDIKSKDFAYNPDWHTSRFILSTVIHQHTLELLFIPKDNVYVLFNRTTQEIDFYNTFSDIRDVLIALTSVEFNKPLLLNRSVKIDLVDTPEKDPFINERKNKLPLFNMFVPSEGLQILRGKVDVKDYREPTLILDFFKHLIPCDNTRDKFIRYIAYKYNTYAYSPLFFVQSGVVGAGKGMLVSHILAYLSGDKRIASVRLEQVLNTFNAHLMGTDWLEVEEAGEGYSKGETKKLTAELKRLTGNSHIAVTRKGKDSDKSQRHYVTPILSTNLETKLITNTASNDRRMVIIRSPKALETILPYTHRGKVLSDTAEYLHELKRELPLFARYLGMLHITNPLNARDYMNNDAWKTDDYYSYIEKSLSEADKLGDALSKGNANAFADVLEDAGVEPKAIDDLFSLQFTGKGTSVLLYHTTKSKMLGVPSVQDLVDSTVSINAKDAKDALGMYRQIHSQRFQNITYKLNIITFEGEEYTKRAFIAKDTAWKPETSNEPTEPIQTYVRHVHDEDAQVISF